MLLMFSMLMLVITISDEWEVETKHRPVSGNTAKRSGHGTIPARLDIENSVEDWCTAEKKLSLKYVDKNGKYEPIICGKNYKLSVLFDDPPEVFLDKANPLQVYTLVMLDPDAPSRMSPVARNWLHWLVVNIKDADITSGDIIMEYNPPTPPSNTGKHRYIFLLLEQTKEASKTKRIPGRAKFDIGIYAEKNELDANVTGFTYFTTQAND